MTDAEASMDRTTGYVLWAYAIVVMVVTIHISTPGAAVSNGWPLWKDLLLFFGYVAVIFPIVSAATHRVNPFEWVLDRFHEWIIRVLAGGNRGDA